MSKVFLWDLDSIRDKVECYGCSINCELFKIKDVEEYWCKECAQKEEIEIYDSKED